MHQIFQLKLRIKIILQLFSVMTTQGIIKNIRRQNQREAQTWKRIFKNKHFSTGSLETISKLVLVKVTSQCKKVTK